MRHRWTEQEASAPLDLRLALPALAVWAGCLVGLWAIAAAWWVVGGAGAVLGGCGLYAIALRRASVRGRSWRSDLRGLGGIVAVVGCVGAATILTTLRMDHAADDPLVAAAARGDWVSVTMTVGADPSAVATRFSVAGARTRPAGEAAGDSATNATPGTADATGRWRLTGRASQAQIRGSSTPSDSAVTVFGDGPAWASLVNGQIITVRGVASPDSFGAVPGVVVRAKAVQRKADPPWWSQWAVTARAALARTAADLDADRGGLLRGLVVGDKRGINPELSGDAKITGLTHLVAVSGTHVAIACGAVVLLLRRFGPRWSAIGTAMTLVAIVIVVGPTPSVLRAVVMGVIGVGAVVLARGRNALPALSAAVFGLLLFDPTLAVSAGFALSVQATAGLVLLAPVWTRALERRGVPRGWAMLLAVPVAAHITTMPVIAALSGNISLVAIPANIVVAPVVAPALLLGLVCLVTGPFLPSVAVWLARCDGPLLGWITGTAHHLARWPSATVPWPASATGVLALAGLTLALLLLFRHRHIRAGICAAVVGVVVVAIPARIVAVGWPADGWLLTACEVGQGDAMVLSTNSASTAVVIDTGPDPDAVDACLRRLHITTVALVVLTHLHADHIDGLSGVLRGRKVAAIGMGPDHTSPTALHTIAALARSNAVPIVGLDVGTSWQAGDLTMDVLGPARQFHGTDSDPNNDSVVVMASRLGVKMLLAGDIERPAQRSLMRSRHNLAADILKQPHHGSSKLLPELVAAISPEVAVIGVGAGNDYGHPTAAALRIDRAAGVTQILRTDTDGDVQVCWSEAGLSTVIRGPSLRSTGAADAGSRQAAR